jgi:hypothetical protein
MAKDDAAPLPRARRVGLYVGTSTDAIDGITQDEPSLPEPGARGTDLDQRPAEQLGQPFRLGRHGLSRGVELGSGDFEQDRVILTEVDVRQPVGNLLHGSQVYDGKAS